MILRPLVVLLLLAGAAHAACKPGEVELRGPAGHAVFAVEIARTEAQHQRGLMGRKALAADAGMLFVFDPPRAVSFWMHDTLIPLDMLFVRADGTVTRIAPMAVPGDETPIPAGGEVAFVLEINGGMAAQTGLAEGAVMRSPEVLPATAKWPCATP